MGWQEVYITKDAYVPDEEDTDVFEFNGTESAAIWYLLARTLMERGENVLSIDDPDDLEMFWGQDEDYKPFDALDTPDLLKLYKKFRSI